MIDNSKKVRFKLLIWVNSGRGQTLILVSWSSGESARNSSSSFSCFRVFLRRFLARIYTSDIMTGILRIINGFLFYPIPQNMILRGRWRSPEEPYYYIYTCVSFICIRDKYILYDILYTDMFTYHILYYVSRDYQPSWWGGWRGALMMPWEGPTKWTQLRRPVELLRQREEHLHPSLLPYPPPPQHWWNRRRYREMTLPRPWGHFLGGYFTSITSIIKKFKYYEYTSM
mgnify:CR=1 FL=1